MQISERSKRHLNVTMIAEDGTLKLVGDAGNVKKAEDILMPFLELSKRGNSITEQNVNYDLLVQWIMIRQIWLQWIRDVICRTIQGNPIKPKTAGQQKILIDLSENDALVAVLPDR